MVCDVAYGRKTEKILQKPTNPFIAFGDPFPSNFRAPFDALIFFEKKWPSTQCLRRSRNKWNEIRSTTDYTSVALTSAAVSVDGPGRRRYGRRLLSAGCGGCGGGHVTRRRRHGRRPVDRVAALAFRVLAGGRGARRGQQQPRDREHDDGHPAAAAAVADVSRVPAATVDVRHMTAGANGVRRKHGCRACRPAGTPPGKTATPRRDGPSAATTATTAVYVRARRRPECDWRRFGRRDTETCARARTHGSRAPVACPSPPLTSAAGHLSPPPPADRGWREKVTRWPGGGVRSTGDERRPVAATRRRGGWRTVWSV